ncbi:DUF2637 domain-containing protein [Kitasatospora sp. NPDC090308]|uniref:DUF2637 domain-containing protein n=1 Tax=Kitasatospora sp. NPDC090308 TaxID=3364082 RepID=UPI0038293786
MRLPRPDAVLIQAAIAGALSFAHLHDVAEAAGQHDWKAWAYPVSVDLLLVAAWRRMRHLKSVGEPVGSAWTWFGIALAASLGANVATAGLLDLAHVPAWLRILVAGWPALAFFGGTLLAHGNSTATEPELATKEVELPVYEPDQLADLPDAEPEPEAVEAPPAPAALPAAPAPAPTPAVAVPAALVDHARKVADDHRARTGEPIDTETLRVRLGVPPHFATAIAAQLT